MDIANNYLESVKRQFQLYKKLGEQSFAQIDNDQFFTAYNIDSNSIAVIIKHLHGNMISRWTDFLSSDGEKPWRKRDDEFENRIIGGITLVQLWEEGWSRLFVTINSLKASNLSDRVTIRGEELSVMDAINRQLCHYSYHVGQIVYAAKQLKKGEWISLSIPRKKS